MHPTEEQRIILKYIQSDDIAAYLNALKACVNGAKNIIACSCISNDRTAVFLIVEQIVNKFIHEFGGIEINGHFIKARK